MTRPLIIHGTDPDRGIQFRTNGPLAVWADDTRLVNATPAALRDGWAWIGANAVTVDELGRLRAAIAGQTS